MEGGGWGGRDDSHQHDAHARTLIDDHDPVAVAELHHLLGVGVVAGAEGVGPEPAQQAEILQQQGPVKALPSDLGEAPRSDPLPPVLMHFFLKPGGSRGAPLALNLAQARGP